MYEPDPMDDDDFFIGYCELHSETPRALFHKDHIARILRLAGYEEAAQATEAQMIEFEAAHDDEMHPLCKQARERLREAERLAREEAKKLAEQAQTDNIEELEAGLFELDQE